MTEEKQPGDNEKPAELVKELRAKPLISEILDRLKNELPKDLHYHSAAHTDDVLREVVLFSLLDGLSDREIELLAVAAAYHDAGFIASPVNNESIGARMARAAMEKQGGFTPDEIRLVEHMILDTRLVETSAGLRQVATSPLSKYLLDADLSNFGREDFFDMGELLRKELGFDRNLFLKRTLELLANHDWNAESSRKLRQPKKEENLRKLTELVAKLNASDEQAQSLSQGLERMAFLAKLPLLLNSSLNTRDVIGVSLDHLKLRVGAEAGTVFLLNDSLTELTFWALRGGDNRRLEGQKMPAGKGIVGWVIERQEAVLINDVKSDPRFFAVIDKESGFMTRNMICVPLTVRGETPIGAIQVINKEFGGNFSSEDLLFVEQFASQVTLAIDNAKMYEALEEKNKKIETLDRRKNEMIAVIAHEFRTPLNVIQTSADILFSGMISDDATRKKMNETLVHGVSRLTKLVSQIKNVSLVSTGDLTISPSKVSVEEMIQSTVSEFSEAMRRRKLRMDVSIGNGVGSVRADLALMIIALKNLIANALRFTPDGGTVSIGANKSSGMVELEVKDTGIGIESSQIPLIFEKFYEVKDVMQHSSGEFEFGSGGLGLGLATVKSILGAHGSSIVVDSTPGKGSSFKFCLQIAEG